MRWCGAHDGSVRSSAGNHQLVVYMYVMLMLPSTPLQVAPIPGGSRLYVTTDRGTNIMAAVNMMDQTLIHLPCFSHVGHRAVLEAINSASEWSSLVQVVMDLATAMNMSHNRSLGFYRYQKERGIESPAMPL